ncbi:MAG: hypothetical protein QOI80_2979 [Solirubrobacteraceae bacterium]|jgi:glycosyltransferase involved in cell wall biosynthesis|nr:hypothetical protein [Solirubrobacteraceae bacterium]
MSRRLDVCFYMPYIGPLLAEGSDLPPGGAETQIFLLAQTLADMGYAVGLIAFDVPGGLPARVGRVHVTGQRRPRTVRRGVRGVAYLRSIVQALRELDADVVVQRAAGSPTGVIGVITRLRRRRFVYSSANVIDFEFERLEPVARNVRLFHLGVRLANTIIVQTEEQGELCRARFGREPAVINSLAEPAAPTDEDPEAFLWIGRLTHYKRPEAFVALARAVPEARFRLVGVPFYEEGERILAELRAAAADLDNLEVLEPRPRGELMQLVDRSAAMVNTAEYEGMPNIFLEAWSRGIPALGFSHDPDGVIVRYGLGGFADGDPEVFAQLAREMWTARHDRGNVARRCLDYIAAEHAPDVVARRWAEALELSRRA